MRNPLNTSKCLKVGKTGELGRRKEAILEMGTAGCSLKLTASWENEGIGCTEDFCLRD